jgi:hypothetical protein
VASTYNCQFQGAMTSFPAAKVWKALVQPKCKFLAWLVLHDRALTTYNMAKKSWTCDPICQLCFSQPENSAHLFTQCNYAKALWNSITASFELPPYSTISPCGVPMEWVIWIAKKGNNSSTRTKLGALFSFWWHMCKECNRRIFDAKECSVPQLASLLKEERSLLGLAHNSDHL